MGGYEGGAAASRLIAREVMKFYIDDAKFNHAVAAGATPEQLLDVMKQDVRGAFLRAQARIDHEANEGNLNDRAGATAAIVKINEIDGEKYAALGNIGDSRIILSRDGKVSGLVTDQSEGNRISNVITPNWERKFTDQPSTEQDEVFVMKLEKGDKILICSDGITGDWSHQFLTEDEYWHGFDGNTPQEIVDRFFAVSKKADDKSAVTLIVE